MFTNSLADKENIQREHLVATPNRKPLKTVQMTAQSTTTEGTPSSLFKKTPRRSLSSVNTPSSIKKHSTRRLKRQSVPFRLSKACPVFEDEMLAPIPGSGHTGKMEDRYLSGLNHGQALNEILREKVLETVTKMKEKYEVCLAEKEKQLKEQSCLIAQLKTEVIQLKNDKEDVIKIDLVNKQKELEGPDAQEDHQVSLFVKQILATAVNVLVDEKPSVATTKIGSCNNALTPERKLDAWKNTTAPNKQTESDISLTKSMQQHSGTTVVGAHKVHAEMSVNPATQIKCATSTTPIHENNCSLSVTPVQQGVVETSRTPPKLADSETLMTPISQTDALTCRSPVCQVNSETAMTPVQKIDAPTSTTPRAVTDSETLMTPIQQTDAFTCRTPVCLVNSETAMTPSQKVDAPTFTTPPTDSETLATPMKQVDALTCMTPNCLVNSGTTLTPVLQLDTLTSVTPLRLTDSENTMTPFPQKDCLIDPVTETIQAQQVESETNRTATVNDILYTSTNSVLTTDTLTSNTLSNQVYLETPMIATVGQTDVATSMTPVELVNQNTMVSPTPTANLATITSPLVAVLQPELISSLPFETLRAELESAAISNELLRGECDELNGKVDYLGSLLTEAKTMAEKECSCLLSRIECLQIELDEAQETIHQMELEKPHSIEDYEEVICRLQKDVLLKEKQITFYIKKSSEADNLQKDLRRMYAKYNTEHQSYNALDQEMKRLVEEHNVKCSECESMGKELHELRNELDEAKVTIEEQEKCRKETEQSQVKYCVWEEQMKTIRLQQKEDMDFMEQERRGLEETAVELEQLVKQRTAELDATKQALEQKCEDYEHLRETVHSLRTKLAEVEEELNAVQSQAYLVMLEQEKELTTVSLALDEAWERLNSVVDFLKEEVNEELEMCESKVVKSQDYKPSLVCSILAAVSGTDGPAGLTDSLAHENEAVEKGKEEEQSLMLDESRTHDWHDSSELTVIDRVESFSQLLTELERYTNQSTAKEQAQMMIQQYLDEIANLEESLEETRKMYEERMNSLTQELENERDKVKKVQREHDNKQLEIESLKLDLQTAEKNFQASRERMEELGERYCGLIEKETENEALNENVRVLERECDKLRKEKLSLENDLNETMERLCKAVEVSEETDHDKRKKNVQESFTELLQKKLKLQKEVEKLRDSVTQFRIDKEKFTQYNARLESKANILASNLIKAEEEIYRLDGVVDRFCNVAQKNREIAIQSKDLRDLLKELNVNIDPRSISTT